MARGIIRETTDLLRSNIEHNKQLLLYGEGKLSNPSCKRRAVDILIRKYEHGARKRELSMVRGPSAFGNLHHPTMPVSRHASWSWAKSEFSWEAGQKNSECKLEKGVK